MMLPCLQCKLSCVFTINKDQLGWRTKHISLGFMGYNNHPYPLAPFLESGGYHYKRQAAMHYLWYQMVFIRKQNTIGRPTYIMTSHTRAGVKRWQLSVHKCMGSPNASSDLPDCYTTDHLHAMVIANWRGGLFVKYVVSYLWCWL